MRECNVDRVVAEILAKRDPEGYYVILAEPSAREVLNGFKGIVIEEAGGSLVARTRSRSLVEKLVRRLAKAGLLKC